jgi:hypothetical protein
MVLAPTFTFLAQTQGAARLAQAAIGRVNVVSLKALPCVTWQAFKLGR